MLERRLVFEIHRLKDQGLSCRKIALALRLDRGTVSRHLRNPEKRIITHRKTSKLDVYKPLIEQILHDLPKVPATVILRRLRDEGYTGGRTILGDYLRGHRQAPSRRAFIRIESPPGRQMQVDWGHFGALEYGKTTRRLYAFVITEAYSRMLYVAFTHSQNQANLHQCLLSAFAYFGGTPQELVVDNMLTAVTERQGPLIRFNDAFLDFLRPLKVNPRACNVRSPEEKGKVERSVRYIRQNFWPLREIRELADANAQVRRWLDEVANVRIHSATGDKPIERFKNVHLKPLPEHRPDCRETVSVLVHKDFAVRFDGNAYTVPPWNVGKRLILKADDATVSIFSKDKTVAVHPRCWEHKQRIETPTHVEQVKRLRNKLWKDRDIALFASLGEDAAVYLTALADASQPIRKNIARLLELRDEYGPESLLYAIRKATRLKVYGADYIENILYQEMTPQRVHPPVRIGNELDRLRLSMPSLVEYDAIAIKRSRS